MAALAELGRNAGAWAETYVRLVEELVKRGVPESEARDEAARSANVAAYATYEREPCEVCGHDPDYDEEG